MFKQRKNKRFNYRPRFNDNEISDSRRDFEHKWDELKEVSQKRGKRSISLPVMLVMLVAVLVLMYILNGYM